ncbi:chromosome condensation protein CcrB [Sporosarcina luteola]|uniref:Fluoride-specific ion channel FluC n=1 Tax=Sporosarcina luteola TaxID=582850 RepID=A0A511Z8Z8_9BACL|nr:CrcB family protein [Sporosarcina luteola]GEN83893.1 chromosome condensation protein CcrB [Sporosarcina luteola]
MKKAFFVGIAGALGAICRVGIGELIGVSSDFPFATFAVNMAGTFLLCFLSAGVIQRITANEELRTAITTGFLGSFTTFSAFSMETVSLFQNSHLLFALLYIAGSILGGLMFGIAGMRAGWKVVRG